MKSNARAEGGHNLVEALPECAQTIVLAGPLLVSAVIIGGLRYQTRRQGSPIECSGDRSTTSMFGARSSDARR